MIKIGDKVAVKSFVSRNKEVYEVLSITIDLKCEYGCRYPINVELSNGCDYWLDCNGIDVDETVLIMELEK